MTLAEMIVKIKLHYSLVYGIDIASICREQGISCFYFLEEVYFNTNSYEEALQEVGEHLSDVGYYLEYDDKEYEYAELWE